MVSSLCMKPNQSMKTILSFLLALCVSIPSFVLAQGVPQKMNYQAVARTADGVVIADKEVGLRIAIVSSDNMERPVYAEEHLVTTNKLGLMNLQIGTGEVLEGSMETIDWGGSAHYLKIFLDADNIDRFIEMGTSQLLTVPYAFYAERSGSSEAGGNRNDPNDWTINGNTGTDDATNFLGTTDAQDLVFRTNDIEVGRFTTDGELNFSTGGRLTIGGSNALHMTGTRNVAIGPGTGEAIYNGGSGSNNAFIGDRAGQSNTTGSRNALIGYQAGNFNTTGNNLIAIGARAGYNNTTGNSNSFIGFQSGYSNTDGQFNNYQGYFTGRATTGSDNTFMGHKAGQVTTTGDGNTFLGSKAGETNVEGTNNTYIGKNAKGAANLTNSSAFGAGAQAVADNMVQIGDPAVTSVRTSGQLTTGAVTYPNVDGTLGQVLTTNGAGGIAWSTPTGGGVAGPTGAPGTNGSDGADGATGTNGSDGADGATGATGTNGSDGADGATGTNGSDGADGATGATGTNGSDGADGATGATGTNGSDGADGATGTNGSDGADGATGATGTNGSDGADGATGATGTNGSDGADGATGATGTNGPDGADGATGATGTNGSDGATGAPGSTGPLVSGNQNETLRHNGSNWESNSFLVHTGSSLGVGVSSPSTDLQVNSGIKSDHIILGLNTETSTNSIIANGAEIYIRENGLIGDENMITFDKTNGVRYGIGISDLGPPYDNSELALQIKYNGASYNYGTSSGNADLQGEVFMHFSRDSRKRIGVWTTNPTTEFDIDGQIRMRTDASDGFIPVSDADGVMTWTDPSAIFTDTDNQDLSYNSTTNILSLTGDGTSVDLSTLSNTSQWSRDATNGEVYPSTIADKVGIGTSSPEAMLHIGSTLPIDEVLHLSTAVNSTAHHAVSIGFSHDNSASRSYLAAFIKAEQAFVNDNRTNLIFGTRGTNSTTATATEHLVISYDGNVGIGINSDPEFKLDLGASAGLLSSGIRAPGLATNIVRPAGSLLDVFLSNYDESSYVQVKADGDIEIGNDAGTSKTELYGTTIAKNIEATDVIGLQLKDDGGNLGIHVSDGGNVGVGKLATNAKLAIDGDLDVDGKSRIGWHGHDNFITVPPLEVSPSTHTGDWEILNNGGYKRIYGGTDGFLTATAPVGYKITGYIFNFSNVPDKIEVFYCNVGAIGSTSLTSKTTYTTSNSIYVFQDTFTFNHDSADYISIRIINDSSNAFEFLGGVITIEKCTSGCGL
jgi:hypothetical protein